MIFSEKPKKTREFPEFCDSVTKIRREFWQLSVRWLDAIFLSAHQPFAAYEAEMSLIG